MRKTILIAFTALLMFSCKLAKRITQTDKTQTEKTIERRKITRPGDTITIDIPNIRYKDTTIVRTNYENRTVARVTYDEDGNQSFECLSAEIKEELELIKESILKDVVNDSDVKREFNPQYFIYALAVLAGIVLIGIVIVSYLIMRIQKKMPSMTADIVKKLIN